MKNSIHFKKIRKLIELDKLSDAIEELKKHINDKDLLNDLIMQSAKYQELQLLNRNGVLDFEQLNIAKAKIRYSLLQIINEMENSQIEIITPNHRKKIFIAFIFISAFLLFFYFFGFFQKEQSVIKSFSDLENLTFKYNQNFDVSNPNNINKLWHPFTDKNGWNAYLKDGYYILENSINPYAMKYLYVENEDEENIVSIEVKTEFSKEGNPLPSSGLLLDFDIETGYYYAFTLNPQGEYSIFRKDGRRIETLFSDKLKNISSEKFIKVSAIVRRRKILLYVNNELVKQLKIEKSLKSRIGLIAIGKGKFYYDNFKIYQN